MIAQGFKPVGWVAGVAAAAIGCYMLSLNVAAERAELTKLEWRIVMAKRDIRTLQTELGTRGRLQQLENWNANVLALSAPTSAQFLDSEVTLARFDQREKTVEDHASTVHMASADAEKVPAKPQAKVHAPVHYAAAPVAPLKEVQPLVHRASLTIAEPKPVELKKKPEPKLALAAPKKATEEAKPAKKTAMIDDKLAKDIGEAAKAEKSEKSKVGRAGGQ